MTNPRFEWINWRCVCNTAADLVTQDYSPKSDGTNAETEVSGCVLQPSPRAASQASHTLRACTRAMAIGARWGRAREGGVDRGDGIATDGGQRVSYDDLHRLRRRLLEQATDDRIEIFAEPRGAELAVETPNTDGTGLRLWLENNGCEVIDAKMNGSGHGYATVRPADDKEIATDGGTETVTLRLKDPELQQAVADAEEEYGNRSEAIRAALRATYTGEGDAPTTTADGGPTTKAIEAHEWMVDYAGVGGRIGIDTARSLIAQKFQIKAKTIDNLIFRPLEKNDWIAVSQGLHSVAIVVKPRPGTNAADAQEVPADD